MPTNQVNILGRRTNGQPVAVRCDDVGRIEVIGGGGAAMVVIQPNPDLLNANANIQVGDVDVSNANPVPVSDAGGSITVDIGASENHIGQVGSEGTTIAQTPAITAGLYAAGDAVGGLLTFANAARLTGGGGVIKTVVMIDDAGQDAGLQLWLFSVTFTPMVDNNPWAPAEADLENLVGVITTDDSAQGWLAAGDPSAITIDVATRYDVTGTSLFGQLVTPVSTPTYVATDDLTVKIGLLTD